MNTNSPDSRLAIDDPRLTRAVTDYLSLALINASSIVIDGFMNGHGFNIPGFDGMTADALICMTKEGAKLARSIKNQKA